MRIVGSPGFSLDDARVRRAGLDYWPNLDLRLDPDEAVAREQILPRHPVLFSKTGNLRPWDIDLTNATHLVFGSEIDGLDKDWLDSGRPVVGFPQSEKIRSYNLASAVHSAIMEWLRQVEQVQRR